MIINICWSLIICVIASYWRNMLLYVLACFKRRICFFVGFSFVYRRKKILYHAEHKHVLLNRHIKRQAHGWTRLVVTSMHTLHTFNATNTCIAINKTQRERDKHTLEYCWLYRAAAWEMYIAAHCRKIQVFWCIIIIKRSSSRAQHAMQCYAVRSHSVYIEDCICCTYNIVLYILYGINI